MGRLLRYVLVTLAAVALAACGPSGGSASTPGGRPSAGPASPGAESPAQATPAAPSAAASGCQKTTDTAGGVAVTIVNFAFSPAAIQAKVGQPITFTNQDSISHGAVLDDDRSCSTGSFGQGGSGSLVFSKPGTYPFHCTVHSSMTGTIEITE